EEMILRDMVLELTDSCEQYEMKINANKTKTMVIGRKVKKVNLRILNEAIQQVDSFTYLGCTISYKNTVARMGESRNAYRVLVGRPEGKRPLGRPRRRWEDNIKMDLREVGCDDRDWINLAQDRDRWRAYVRAAMKLRVP
ncbi:hypothetical protein ANN_19832, partial [Periplaneta americana]